MTSSVKLVKYIKGRCGDGARIRDLKEKIGEVCGNTINKWIFLHGGLTEAMTNVSHHAYPNKRGFLTKDKNWYLTGSYNSETNELKIVFFDQGIGIPASLTTSGVREKVLEVLSGIPEVDKRKDEALLKAAVELDRTSTDDTARGKGLQDLLEFIRQRNDGYLSIMSSRGLYKFSVINSKEEVKTEHFDYKIFGTLIIWSARLES